jgi:hypothetical protein
MKGVAELLRGVRAIAAIEPMGTEGTGSAEPQGSVGQDVWRSEPSLVGIDIDIEEKARRLTQENTDIGDTVRGAEVLGDRRERGTNRGPSLRGGVLGTRSQSDRDEPRTEVIRRCCVNQREQIEG